MKIHIKTDNEIFEYDEVTKVVYHTDEGDITYTSAIGLEDQAPSNRMTIFHNGEETTLSDNPLITKITI